MCRILSWALIVLSLSTTPAWAQRFHPRPMFFPPPFFGPHVSFVSMLPSGNFVLATPGSLNLSTRSFVPSARGTSLLIGQGVFMPANGTFVPALNGNFIVATREAFNPKTRTFFPSDTGPFVFATRGDLVASKSGQAVMSFLPFTLPFTPSMPFAFVPSTATAAINPYSPYMTGAMNPYAAGLSNPYVASPSPYLQMNMYGGATPSSAPNGYDAAAATNLKAAADAATGAQTSRQTVAGIAFENGQIKWPLAFRLLPPEKKQDLLDPVEGQLLLAMNQSSNGAPDAAAIQEGKKSVARLSSWLKAHRTDLAEATYQDALAFVRALDAAFTAVKY